MKCTAPECCNGKIIAEAWEAPNHDCPACMGTGLELDVEAILAGAHAVRQDDHRLTGEWWRSQCVRLAAALREEKAALDGARHDGGP